MNRKVTVVGGAGNVGATVARSVAHKELADVVIVDIAETNRAGRSRRRRCDRDGRASSARMRAPSRRCGTTPRHGRGRT